MRRRRLLAAIRKPARKEMKRIAGRAIEEATNLVYHQGYDRFFHDLQPQLVAELMQVIDSYASFAVKESQSTAVTILERGKAAGAGM
jgi:hypothetical protein